MIAPLSKRKLKPNEISPTIAAPLALRLSKVALIFAVAAYFAIVALDNVTDYGTNFKFVAHVLSMDTVPHDTKLSWRSLTSDAYHHAAYLIIIVWEFAAAVLCTIGSFKLARSLHSAVAFNASKTMAILGLTVGVLLWVVAFITVGGEWFMMWESRWDGELAAFRMFTINAFVLGFLSLRDRD